jgi:hypothetical protein
MKSRPLQILVFLTFVFLSQMAFGQSETHNMVTYDTIIPYRGSGSAGQNWVVRITRPVNFFTVGSPDTASRPVLFTMQGDGEISHGTYTFINNYGPHWELANGWNGSVVLGNGTHYPILMTVQQNLANTKANLYQSLFDTLYKEFHPRSVHYAGLSGGAECGGWLLVYQSTLGDEHEMARIQSFVNLSGVAPSFPSGENEQGAQPLPYPQVWGYWAHKYGGKYWSTLGNADDQPSTYLIEQMMNDSVPGSAYFSWVNAGSGGHCCWNTMYDPTQLNWTNQGTFGNANIATDGNAPNTAGDYVYNALTGTSLFQWMLRQGDTTLVGGGSTDTVFTANAGPDRTIYYPQDSIHVVGSGVDSAGTITGYAWATVSGTGATIVSPDSASTAITGLTTGNYSFKLTLTDSRGRMVSDTMLVHVGDTSFKGETHNFITYDTTINYVCLPGYNGCTVGGVQQYFTLRISRPVNYFTPGNADTASRPLILTMPTDSAETDTSYLTRYGPHYWLNNGWDGSVTLENGKHYPLLITVIGSTANIRPFSVQPLMDTLIKYFHPRAHSIHLMATANGFTSLGWYLWFQATAGDEHNMANVRSLTDIEGVNPSTNYGVSTIGYPNAFGYWAHKYGGKFFGLEGSNTDRNIWQISENMNDSVPGSAYYSYEKAGGGAQGSYDSLYNPSVTNWTNTVPYGNAFITTVSPHVNTVGTYSYDPTTGTNIFQWALRQGDTTLAGPGTDTLATFRNIDSAQSALVVATAGAAGDMPLMVYPNPSSTQDVMLTFRNALTGKVSVTVVNVVGTAVQTYQFSKADAWFLQQLPIGGLAKGVYFIKVSMPGYQATKQLIRF